MRIIRSRARGPRPPISRGPRDAVRRGGGVYSGFFPSAAAAAARANPTDRLYSSTLGPALSSPFFFVYVHIYPRALVSSGRGEFIGRSGGVEELIGGDPCCSTRPVSGFRIAPIGNSAELSLILARSSSACTARRGRGYSLCQPRVLWDARRESPGGEETGERERETHRRKGGFFFIESSYDGI